MEKVLLDTSVYVTAPRLGKDAGLALDHLTAGATAWLSSVVLQELYAGAGTRDRSSVEALEHDFSEGRRIVVPNLEDWVQAGKTLAQLALKYGYEKIGRSRLTNDALIAMSAARAGISIITANQRDFARLAEFRFFRWQLATF